MNKAKDQKVLELLVAVQSRLLACLLSLAKELHKYGQKLSQACCSANTCIHGNKLVQVPKVELPVLLCRYVYNKIDVCSVEEVDAIARMPNSIPCSAFQELNMDGLLERMWDMMALVRAYTKKVPPLFPLCIKAVLCLIILYSISVSRG